MAKFISYKDGGKTNEKGISQHLAGLFKGEVINGLAVTQDSPLGMSVLVSKGRCMIDSADDYPYLGFTDANEVVTITAADGSNPRIDAIVAYVDLSVVDSTNANNPGAFEIVAVAGTPAGAPNPPNDGAVSTVIGLGNPFIRLAHVTVGAGVTTITTGNVSDQRVFVGLPDGFIRSSDTLGQGVVKNENLYTGVGEPGGEWDSYTPTFTNLSGGNLTYARYKIIGKTCFFRIRYAITGANVSGGVSYTLPVAAHSTYQGTSYNSIIGEVHYLDNGSSYALGGTLIANSTTTAILYVFNAGGTYALQSGLTASVPFTWANGDAIAITGSYEIA